MSTIPLGSRLSETTLESIAALHSLLSQLESWNRNYSCQTCHTRVCKVPGGLSTYVRSVIGADWTRQDVKLPKRRLHHRASACLRCSWRASPRVRDWHSKVWQPIPCAEERQSLEYAKVKQDVRGKVEPPAPRHGATWHFTLARPGPCSPRQSVEWMIGSQATERRYFDGRSESLALRFPIAAMLRVC